MQNILVNSYVGDVHLSTQGDLPVKYSIRAEEGQEQLLDIDDEGRITVREELDQAGAERRYRVTATDGKRQAETDVVVKIQPAFDCVPELIKGENDVFYINEVAFTFCHFWKACSEDLMFNAYEVLQSRSP